MKTPFPGMDPYLEHPVLWPDVHNRLIAAISDALTPLVAPRYYIGLERRIYLLVPDDLVLLGCPDGSVRKDAGDHSKASRLRSTSQAAVLQVEVPMNDEVGENYLEVHEAKTGTLVTILELLSPANKLHAKGRRQYEEKRGRVFQARTSFVEVDLLRSGDPMPVVGRVDRSDYRILVSRGSRRPRADLYLFSVRQPIPCFTLPLLPGDEEPAVDLTAILLALYDRARFDLRLDYTVQPVPPLNEEDAAWARTLLSTM
jgi:hypothetical protein